MILIDLMYFSLAYRSPILTNDVILLLQSSRKELATDIESLKKKIAGTE